MKALLAGADGFLGRSIVEALLAAGHSARAWVAPAGRAASLERLGAEIVRAEAGDAAPRSSAFDGVEAVINAAALPGPPGARDSAPAGAGSPAAARALLAAAEEAAVPRFVHLSSIEVYALRAPRGHSAGPVIAEDAPLESDESFLTAPVRSCIEAESAAMEFGRRGKMAVFILRAGILYGPGADWRLPRLGIPLGRSACALIGRGRRPLPVCYVENCARAVLHAAENSSATGGVFNIVDDELFTPREFLERLRLEARPGFRIFLLPHGPARAVAEFGDAFGRRLARNRSASPPEFPAAPPDQPAPPPVPAGRSPASPPGPAARAVAACRSRARYSNDAGKKVLGWRPEIGSEEALARTMRSLARSERVSRRADLAALRGAARVAAAPVPVCLIGCGRVAAEHLAILGDLDDVKICGVCDADPEAARAVARQFMLFHAYADAEEMLRKEKPQAVHILTPPDSHAALAELAAKYGCHAFVEAPMALSAAEAARMIAGAKERRLTLCVGHSLLYEPVIVQARRILERGELGDILWVESYYGLDLGRDPASRYLRAASPPAPPPASLPNSPPRRETPANAPCAPFAPVTTPPPTARHWSFRLPGGPCQELAPHPISLALDVLAAADRGEGARPDDAFKPERVHAFARCGGLLSAADAGEIRIFLQTPRAGGVAAVSTAASPAFLYLNIFGTKMTLSVDVLNKCILPRRAARPRPGGPGPLSRAAANVRLGAAMAGASLAGALSVLQKTWSDYDGLELLVREFYASLRENRPPPVSGEEGLRVMEVMDQVWPKSNPNNR